MARHLCLRLLNHPSEQSSCEETFLSLRNERTVNAGKLSRVRLAFVQAGGSFFSSSIAREGADVRHAPNKRCIVTQTDNETADVMIGRDPQLLGGMPSAVVVFRHRLTKLC